MVAVLSGLSLAAATPQPGRAADVPGPLSISHGTVAPVAPSMEELEALPVTTVHVAFGTEHGPMQAAFAGPLLFDVLQHMGAIDAAKPAGMVRQYVTVTGHDGYTAVLALGELSPDFEGKQVILAEKMDGKPLGPDHLRVVVPGDKRGGRSVRDVVRIAVN
jgi:DMSO/TMAO reductase YedYZ molybdopterin-dependent catalytic subunit